jgi:hypothetical protein
MAEKPAVVMIVRNGGVPTIPEKMQGTPGLQDCAGECTGPMYGYMGKSFTPDAVREGHNPGRPPGRPSQKKVAAAFHEVMHNEPSTVARADVSEKRKQKMRVAIALNKARQKG